MKAKVKRVIFAVIGGIVLGIMCRIIITNKEENYKYMQAAYAPPSIIGTINNRFYKYEGEFRRGSEIKNLIQEVKLYNEHLEEGENIVVLEGGNGINNVEVDGIKTIETSSIKNTKRYTVNIEEYYENGQIKKIHIEKVQEDSNSEVK